MYDYIFLKIEIPPGWFRYHNFVSYIKMNLPPNLQDTMTWMGLTVCGFYTAHKQRAGSRYNQDSTIFLHLFSRSASGEVPFAPVIAFPHSRDTFVESSGRLCIFYIPGKLFQLNQCSHIWGSFGSNNEGLKVEMCGMRLLYEQDVEGFEQTLLQCMLEIPKAYHPSLYQNLLAQLAQLP